MNATLARAWTPNEVVSRRTAATIVVGWIGVWLAYWALARPLIFPSPLDVLAAFPELWMHDGLGAELMSSLRVNIEALVLSTAVGLPIAYLSRTPLVRPLATGVSLLRFLSPSIFFLLLLFTASSGHQVKVLMLAAGELFFFVTTMVGVVANLPESAFDDARTLRMSEWRATWYVVVRGTVADAFTAIRDNAAMGWSMLMMVEGVIRSEGGVGVMLIDQNKYQNFAEVYAIAGAVLVVGLGQDVFIGWLRRVCCPYAK